MINELVIFKAISKYEWIIPRYKKYSSKISVPLGFNHLKSSRFFNLLMYLSNINAVKITKKSNPKVYDVFDTFLVILYPNETDQVFFSRLDDLKKLAIAYKDIEEENKYFVMIKVDTIMKKFRNLMNFHKYLEDFFEEYGKVVVKRVNNVAQVKKGTLVIQHVSKNTGKFFLASKDYIYVTENTNIYPSRVTIRINVKLIKLLRKILSNKTTVVKKRFSRYQYQLYNYLKEAMLIEERSIRKLRRKLIRVSEELLQLVYYVVQLYLKNLVAKQHYYSASSHVSHDRENNYTSNEGSSRKTETRETGT